MGSVASRPGGRVRTRFRVVIRPRNVRTPQGTVLGNTQSGRLAGKCHREEPPMAGQPAQARVKRCGKSAPAPGVTRVARQTPPGARPNVGYGRPVRHSPGSDNPLVGRTDGWSHRRREALDRIPPTGRLAIAHRSDQGKSSHLADSVSLGRCHTAHCAKHIPTRGCLSVHVGRSDETSDLRIDHAA